MKKLCLMMVSAAVALFVGCSEPAAPASVMEVARKAMPAEANVALVIHQNANIDVKAMTEAWQIAGADALTAEAQIAQFKQALPESVVKALAALGVHFDPNQPLKDEVVVAMGVALKVSDEMLPDATFGAYVNTGVLDYAALLEIIKAEMAKAEKSVTSDGDWTVLQDGEKGAIALRSVANGVQVYVTEETPEDYDALPSLGADAFLDRAFVTDDAWASSLVLCAKDVNIFAKKFGAIANPQMAILSEIANVYLSVGMNEAEMALSIEVIATSAEAAKKIEEQLIGLRAMANMMVQMNAQKIDLSAITALLSSIKIAATEATVNVAVSITPEVLKQLVAIGTAVSQPVPSVGAPAPQIPAQF